MSYRGSRWFTGRRGGGDVLYPWIWRSSAVEKLRRWTGRVGNLVKWYILSVAYLCKSLWLKVSLARTNWEGSEERNTGRRLFAASSLKEAANNLPSTWNISVVTLKPLKLLIRPSLAGCRQLNKDMGIRYSVPSPSVMLTAESSYCIHQTFHP